MIERFNEAQTDKELLTLRHEVGLIDARIADLMNRVDTGESGRIWSQARGAFSDLRDANRDGDKKKASEALRQLDSLLARGQSDYANWDEIFGLVEQRRRTVESERKHLHQMGQLVAVDQMMGLATALLSAVREHVTDRKQLQLITTEFSRLTDANASG